MTFEPRRGITPADLPEDVTKHYKQFWSLPDGRLCGLLRLLMHWTVHVDLHEFGYEERYCFETDDLAIEAMAAWEGTGDPINWHKHPNTGRIRPDRTPASQQYEPGYGPAGRKRGVGYWR